MTQLWEISIRHDPYESLEAVRNPTNVTTHIVVTSKNDYPTLKEIRAQIGYARLVDASREPHEVIDPPDNSPAQSMYPYIKQL